MVKSLKDYQLQSDKVLIEFVKIAVIMPMAEQTKFIKAHTNLFPLSAIKEAVFINKKW